MLKIAMAQMDVIQGEPIENLNNIESFVKEAKSSGASLVGCPELCLTGFDWNKNRKVLGGSGELLDEVCRISRENGMEIFGSFLEKTENGKMANSLFYIDASGVVLAKYRKIHLFTLFHEETHVTAGNEVVVCPTGLGRTGCSTCYDLRFPELFRACAGRGAEVQILPAAFPHPRLDHWRVLVRARAIENQCYFIAVNQCGNEGGNGPVCYFGHSMVVDPWGEIVFEADDSEGLYFADIDPARVARVRKKMPALSDRRGNLFC